MKKLLITILSTICLLAGVCFAGCDGCEEIKLVPGTMQPCTIYYGVVQTIDEQEGLFVYIPEVGVCDLPSYKDGQQQDITIREGDLIRMDFDAEVVKFLQRYPIAIETPLKSMAVETENIELKQDENDYILTIDYTKALKESFLAYEKDVGDTVYFVLSQGMAGTGNVPSMEIISEYCTATIELITTHRLSLRLQLGNRSIQEFLQDFAAKRARISVDFKADKQPLVNFFDIIDGLKKSDIQKIETVEYAGSVSPAVRAPIEYKTSTLSADIDAIYIWLSGLKETLTPITDQEAQVSGGGAIFLTVYTRLGTFKINEGARNNLYIWNGYFEQEGKMPDLVGETVTYTFESYSNQADIYMGILDDGVKVGTTNFDFEEMVCVLSDETFTSEQFRIVADIGELTVYDGTHFKRNGKIYEIVSEPNFSQIISEYFLEF